MAGKPSTATPLKADNPTVKLAQAKEETVPTVVHFTDGTTEKEAFYLKLLKSSLADETLSDLRANIAGLTGSIEISHHPFLNEAATGPAFKYVPELEERDWAVVSESNALCYGIRVIWEKKKTDENTPKKTPAPGSTEEDRGVPVALERARYPAFRLRKRTIYSDALPNSSIRGVKLDLRVPDYIIDDRSYVATYETETEIQASMASSSFSETDVSAAGGGSVFGFSLEVSASYSQSSSAKDSSESTKKSKKVTIAYNFPRVTIFLDERSLELTPECSAALALVTDAASLRKFQDEYGEFFSSRVQLGGRLFATEDVASSASSSSREVVSAMKAAASASFSGWGASASVSASHGQESKASQSGSTRSATMSLTWQANGGDTLLCNHPTQWAPTVAHHWNWRITKQDKIAGLLDSIAQLRGMEGLAAEAERWGVKTPLEILRAKPKPPKQSNTFTLNAEDCPTGRFLLAYPADAYDLCMTRVFLDSNVQSRGCVLLGPKKVELRQELLLYEAESANGDPATEIKYGTKYRVKNKSTDGAGNEGSGVVPDGGTVTLHFFKYDNPLESSGYVHVIVEDKRNAYLCVKRTTDSGTLPPALKLVMKYS
ncbi:MAC/Perforin domain-containing protein [Hirsutella rhossiliensis]|uniref:MAC/Perforin domain-containing protein n=1 Tax=Hirsutella rhossiliensis TaxID=111463 RepID=A0A9P8MXE7_9HYPO|nr:MAC/Perforin domain-containing protein [Hirsutella rhossiliensis]KAH0962949.1 MAC/Perforin domain-containing protein [Hirsutella rhossiliensis]